MRIHSHSGVKHERLRANEFAPTGFSNNFASFFVTTFLKSLIMKLTQIFSALIFILTSQIAQASNDVEQGALLYKTYCSACHGATGGMDMNKRIAPPIIAVRMHYIGRYPDKTSFVAAVTNWVEKQDASKTLMRGAIRKFNIMPPVAIAREDAQKIAAYIYEGNIDKPAGFDKHFEEMHGKQGGNSGM